MTPSSWTWGELPADAPVGAILEWIDAGWAFAWPRLGEMDAAELDAPLARQEWCPRELMAHLAHWNDAHWFAVSEHLAGRHVEIYEGWREKNNERFGNDRVIPTEEAASRLQASHVRLRALLESLTPAQWDEDVRAWILQCPVSHYREHLAAL